MKVERDAVELLWTISLITVTAGAANQDLTVQRRAALLIRLRQAVIAAREHLVFVNSKSLIVFLG